MIKVNKGGTGGETNYLYNYSYLSPRSIDDVLFVSALNKEYSFEELYYLLLLLPRLTRQTTLPCLLSRPTNITIDNTKHINYI